MRRLYLRTSSFGNIFLFPFISEYLTVFLQLLFQVAPSKYVAPEEVEEEEEAIVVETWVLSH